MNDKDLFEFYAGLKGDVEDNANISHAGMRDIANMALRAIKERDELRRERDQLEEQLRKVRQHRDDFKDFYERAQTRFLAVSKENDELRETIQRLEAEEAPKKAAFPGIDSRVDAETLAERIVAFDGHTIPFDFGDLSEAAARIRALARVENNLLEMLREARLGYLPGDD